MKYPFLIRSLGVVLIAAGLFTLPVLAQNPAPKERKEKRSTIRVVDNGVERKLEIVEKDGKVLLNGKPIEQANPEDKELYSQFKVEDTLDGERVDRTITFNPKEKEDRQEEKTFEVTIGEDGSVTTSDDGERQRNTTIKGRKKGGKEVKEEKRVTVTIGGDGQGSVIAMPEEDDNGERVYRWKRKSTDGKEEEIEEMPRMRGFRWEGSEPLRQFRMALPKGETFLREGHPFGEMMDEVRVNIEELRGSEFAEVARLEREARDLSRQIKYAKDAEKAALERELDAKLNEIFDKKTEARRKKVNRLEEELNAERDQLRARERARREMIERRKQELLRGSDPLSW